MSASATPLGAIVLDFDGVILESVDIKTDVFRELFSPYPEQLEAILSYHLTHNGISRVIKLRYIFETILHISYTAEWERKTRERFSQLAYDRVLACPFVPGALEFLRQFSTLCPLYVASATPEEELQRVIQARDLSSFFAGVFGHPVKKREVIERAQRTHHLAPQQVLYVGDSLEDWNVAREAGVDFIGRRNKEPFPENRIPVFDDLVGIADNVKSRIIKRVIA